MKMQLNKSQTDHRFGRSNKVLLCGAIAVIAMLPALLSLGDCLQDHVQQNCGPTVGSTVGVNVTDCHGSQVEITGTVTGQGVQFVPIVVYSGGLTHEYKQGPCNYSVTYTDPCTGQTVNGSVYSGLDIWLTKFGVQC